MDAVTQNAQQMYDEYSFGKFSYGDKREQYERLLFAMFAEGNNENKTLTRRRNSSCFTRLFKNTR